MSKYQIVPEGKDPEIWEIARKRVSFFKHAMVYVIVNAFLWGLWFFTGNEYSIANNANAYPWPIWTSLGWGIGLAFSFANAYIFPVVNSTENEYQKLINNK